MIPDNLPGLLLRLDHLVGQAKVRWGQAQLTYQYRWRNQLARQIEIIIGHLMVSERTRD